MSDVLPMIETLEHQLMRAWMGGDSRILKALTSGKFRMVIGSKPTVVLDAPSWLDAAGSRFVCNGYRFGDLYARKIGSVAVLAGQLELNAKLDGISWSGAMWVTDVWRKDFRRKWRMTERVLSRQDERADSAAGFRRLQLWK